MGKASWTSLFAQPLSQAAPDVARLISIQRERNANNINLVASESYGARAAIEAEGSLLVNKNASGYPPRKAFGDGEVINELEALANSRAKKLFNAEHANIQALTSTIANVAVLRAFLAPGDRILAFDQIAGGHSSHGSKRHLSGKDYSVHSFGVVPTSGLIDYDQARTMARQFQPKMIIAGSTAYPRMIDFAILRQIADECGALLFSDIAHVAGLVIAGIHPNPVPFSDVATTSTHKTLCGPRTGGLILCKARYASQIDAALSPGIQAAAAAHIIAGRAVLFDLVQRPEFHALMHSVVANARALADRLSERGLPLYAGGTDTHMLTVDLRNSEWDELKLNSLLVDHGIVANTMGLPPLPGAVGKLGLRLGSTPMTIRGADAAAFHVIADAVADILSDKVEGEGHSRIRKRMNDLALQHPIPYQ